MGKVLGIDIGVSSVGWGIADADSGEIIDAGVRLFEEATRNANEDRRNFRGSRRLKRRRMHRLERMKRLLEESGFSLDGIGSINPYEARRDAIYGEVSEESLAAAVYHITKRRGVVLDVPDIEEDSGDELSTKEQLARNRKLLKDQYICEIQLARSQDGKGTIRSHSNRFSTSDYMKELAAILHMQKQYHEKLTDELIGRITELVETRREYHEGPGSKISPTPYGTYSINKFGQLEEVSMINKMRGYCTYFPDQQRIPKMSYTADLYNLLNGDLNKMQINGEYLTPEDKRHFVETIINKGKNITLAQILKYKKSPKDAVITGCRVNVKNDQPLFTEFTGYKVLLKLADEHNFPKDLLSNFDLLDEIIDVLTAEKSYTRREEKLEGLLGFYEETERTKIIDALKETTEFKGYHALSKKAIMIIMDDLWNTNKNQMELYSERNMEQKRLEKLTKKKDIQFDGDAVLSTVAKRAHREAIKIVNAARRKYGEFDSIVVETAREKNSEDAKNKYKKFQKEAGKFEKRMAKLLMVSELKELKLNGKQHLALKLWDSQDGKCIYSGRSISANDIVANPTLFEIDHIIPISISFDDSQSNKVLCYHSQNQKKGQRTPHQYLTGGDADRSFDQFKVDVLALFKSRKINGKKKDHLLEMRDVYRNEELQKQFINRNLIDTQYAMRSFSTNLRTYFEVNGIDTTVLSIRGAFTAAIRRRAKMNKDRDSGHAHHAIDALIVAAIGKMPVFKLFREFDMDEQGVIFQKDTGEILAEEDFFSGKMVRFFGGLRNYESHIKYSHKVDRKGNRIFSDLTIFGTRTVDGEQRILRKYKDIYNAPDATVTAILNKLKTSPDDFLIAKHNPEILLEIQKIAEHYKAFKNPFKAYYEENGYILKDGKVPVKSLRYYGDQLGSYIPITQKYPHAKNEVILMQIKSVRIDVYKTSRGKYRYVGVPYYWLVQEGQRLRIDMEKYNAEVKNYHKQIDDKSEFLFSLYKNDVFSFERKGLLEERVFRSAKASRRNIVETDYLHKRRGEGERSKSTISFSLGGISDIVKYNVDVLGNKHKIYKEKFNMYLQN